MSNHECDTPASYDVIIIGGGPAGLTAAIYCARANLKTLVIDKGVKSGALGITSKIANYPGVAEEVSGEQLVQIMRDQAEKFGAVMAKGRVAGVSINGTVKNVVTSDGRDFTAKALIIATGAMGRKSTLPGEENLLGKGVSYCATCDAAFFKGRSVAVIGWNEETVEEALFLTRFASKVYMVNPKEDYSADREVVESLKSHEAVEFRLSHRPVSIGGEAGVKSLTISSIRENDTEVLNVEGVFIFTQGNKPVVDYLNGGVQVSDESCVLVDRSMRTNMEGVFACGDVLCNEVQQAVVASAQGCIAALSADKYINKRQKAKKDYS